MLMYSPVFISPARHSTSSAWFSLTRRSLNCVARRLLRSHDFSCARFGKAMNPQSDPLPPHKSDLLKGHRNFASAAKAWFKPYYARIPRFAVGPTPEDDRLRFDRIFKPWPKWV